MSYSCSLDEQTITMIILTMDEWWSALSGTEHIFWILAILSSVIFFIVFVVSLFGFDTDSDIDTDTGTDGDAGGDLPIFSLKALTAFTTFFSWTGVLLLQNGKSLWQIIPYSFLSGILALGLVVFLLKKFSDFTESGNPDLIDLIFEKGDVYLPIPPAQEGKGKVHVILNHGLREMNAVTSDRKEIHTGEKIRVLEILPDNTLLVEKIES